MAKPIEIQFLSDVADVVRDTSTLADRFGDVSDALADVAKVDTNDVAEGLDDGADAARDLIDQANKATRELQEFRRSRGDLDDLADSASDAGRELADVADAGKDLGDGVAKGADEAGDAVRSLDDDVRDTFRKLADRSRDAGDALGDSTKRGAAEASEGLNEFKDEANGTAREAAASFDGSADSIADMFQETAANAFIGFGPAGAAAGLAVAAGLGFAIAKLQEGADEANATAEAVAELGRELYEAGGDWEGIDWASRMQDWGLAIQDNKEWWEVWQAEARTGLEVVRDLSDEAGLSFRDMFKGATGDADDAADALAEIEAAIKHVEDQATYTTDAYSGMRQMDPVSAGQLEALEELRGLASDNAAELARAEEAERLLADAGIETAAAVEEANEALVAHADALRAVADTNIGATESAVKYHDTLASANETIATNGQILDLNTAAGRANQGALTDLASATLGHVDALIAQGDSTATVSSYTQAARDSFIASAEAAGYSRDQARALADQYGLVPDNVDTWVQAHNVEQTRASIDGVAAPREASVDVVVGSDHVTPYLRGLRPTVYADVMVNNSSILSHLDD